MTQTIEIPEGFELKKVSDTEYKIVKKKKVLPKTWEEFCKLNPIAGNEYYIASNSKIVAANLVRRSPDADKNNLPSEEKAEAILALCQLIQLRDCYNNGWKPDWNDNSDKFVISLFKDEVETDVNVSCTKVLAFESSELRDRFFYNFKDLIEKLKPLYE